MYVCICICIYIINNNNFYLYSAPFNESQRGVANNSQNEHSHMQY